MEKEEKIVKASWNLSQQNIQLVGDLIKQGVNAFSEGNFQDCFVKYNCIKFIVGNRFTEEEHKELLEIEGLAAKGIKKPTPGFGDNKQSHRTTASYLYHLQQYINLISKLLRKYNLDIGDKETKRKLN